MARVKLYIVISECDTGSNAYPPHTRPQHTQVVGTPCAVLPLLLHNYRNATQLVNLCHHLQITATNVHYFQLLKAVLEGHTEVKSCA